MKRLVLASTLFACAACTPAPVAVDENVPLSGAAGPSLVPAIGMLEQRLGATTTEPTRFVVRLMFQNDGAGWTSLNQDCADEACLETAVSTLPPSTTWKIVHAGEVKGAVTATTPAKWSLHADVGTQDVAADELPPTVGQPTVEFASDEVTPVYRPLVAVSAPSVSDPDGWRAGSPSPDAQGALHAAFRAKFASETNCQTEGGADLQPITYADADIATSSAYASARGWTVATAHLNGYRCDGPLEDTAFAPQAFAISPDGRAQYLGESLKLVDAGDFDGNGKSELVFAIQGHNSGGYDLRFDNFAGQATFAFSYH